MTSMLAGCVGNDVVSAARNAGANSSLTCWVSAAFNAFDNLLRRLVLAMDSRLEPMGKRKVFLWLLLALLAGFALDKLSVRHYRRVLHWTRATYHPTSELAISIRSKARWSSASTAPW